MPVGAVANAGRDVAGDRRRGPSLLSGYERWLDALTSLTSDSGCWGRLWAVAGPERSGKTYVTACLSYLLSTSRERALPVDATLSLQSSQTTVNGELLAALGKSAMQMLADQTFEALSTLRQVIVRRYEAVADGFLSRSETEEELTHVILDLGSGTLHTNLGFLPLADDPVVVTRVNQEAFVRTLMVLYRAVLESWRLMFQKRPKAVALIQEEIDSQGKALYGDLRSFLRRLMATDIDAYEIARVHLERFRPGVIFNAFESEDAGTAIEELWQLSAQEVGVELDYLGSLPVDPGAGEFVACVRPIFVSNSQNPGAAWAAREMARKLRVTDDSEEDDDQVGMVIGRQDMLANEVLRCTDRCDKWPFCEYRDPGYPCTIQYLQPDEYGLIRPVHLERYNQPASEGQQATGLPGRSSRKAVGRASPARWWKLFWRRK